MVRERDLPGKGPSSTLGVLSVVDFFFTVETLPI